MELISLEILPKGVTGWGSRKLTFAKEITQLYGENGSGKTPIVKSLAYALGYKCEFRDEIYTRCDSVRLITLVDGKEYQFRRFYSKDNFYLEATCPLGNKQNFHTEGSFSEYLFETVGLDYPNLVTTKGKVTKPYFSSISPVYYLDQNIGYSDFYKSVSSNFISDQFSEMVRIAAGLNQKNSFDKKKNKILAKEELEFANKQFVRVKDTYERAVERKSTSNNSVEVVNNRIYELKEELATLQESSLVDSDLTVVMDNALREKVKLLNEIKLSIDELNTKIRSTTNMRSEIDSEINTLSLNEESRRVFMSFEDICSVDGCGMFLNSTESYAKNLVYLKDQIKDLSSLSTKAEEKVSDLLLRANKLEEEIGVLKKEREEVINNSQVSNLIKAIKRTTKELVLHELEKSQLEEVELLEKQLVEKQFLRDKAQEKLENVDSSVNKETVSLITFKNDLKSLLVPWLGILHTVNVPRQISLKQDFKAFFGGESLNTFDGSTRLRIVLSYHAALIETIAKANPKGFRFFILDTPRQHDISADDLNSYMVALKKMANETGIQIIFSSTEYRYSSKDKDMDWLPDFSGFEQLMFLGSVSK